MKNHTDLNKRIYNDTKKKSQKYPFEKVEYVKDLDIFKINDSNENSNEKRVMVFDKHPLEVARILYEKKYYPLLVCDVNNVNAGGSVSSGMGHLEEDIYRQTNIIAAMGDIRYRLDFNDIMYSPSITVFKDSTGKMSKPFDTSILLTPVLNQPMCVFENGREIYESRFDKIKMEEKIDSIFKAAVKCEYEAILFGMFACDKFRNPIKEITDMVNRMIKKYNIYYVFFALHTTEINKTKETEEKINVFNSFINKF